jgi:hypothetical protein
VTFGSSAILCSPSVILVKIDLNTQEVLGRTDRLLSFDATRTA